MLVGWQFVPHTTFVVLITQDVVDGLEMRVVNDGLQVGARISFRPVRNLFEAFVGLATFEDILADAQLAAQCAKDIKSVFYAWHVTQQGFVESPRSEQGRINQVRS